MTAARGQALVEALAALLLVAAAGAIVAAAAAATLRATRQAEVLQRLVRVAERELALLQLGDPLPGWIERPLSEPGLADTTAVHTVSRSASGLADLAVTVTAGRPQQRVMLSTRMLVRE